MTGPGSAPPLFLPQIIQKQIQIEVERNPFEEDQDPATPDLGAKLGDVWKAAGAGDQVELQKQVAETAQAVQHILLVKVSHGLEGVAQVLSGEWELPALPTLEEREAAKKRQLAAPFYTRAWAGPKKGAVSQASKPLGELVDMYEKGFLTTEVEVCGEDGVWRELGDVLLRVGVLTSSQEEQAGAAAAIQSLFRSRRARKAKVALPKAAQPKATPHLEVEVEDTSIIYCNVEEQHHV